MRMDLSIIFVNYKTPGLVMDCISSIYKETRQYSFEIIVVDNHSGDDSKRIILEKFPPVNWIQMDYNSGFSRANNEGIRAATGDYVLILNTDTIILDGALDKTINLFKKEKGIAACGVQLLNPDMSHQISGAHFVKGGLNFLLPLPYFGRLVRFLGYSFKATVPSISKIEKKQEVDWIVGAFIFTTKEIAIKSGMFDEDFFMYAEEIEWCYRLKKFGKLVLFEEPKVIHIGGATSMDYYDTEENENGKNLWNKKGRQVIVSMMLRIRKQFGIFWFLLMLSAFVIEIPIFSLCLFFDKIFRGEKAMFKWKNLKNYSLNIFTLLKYSLKIIINRPHFYKLS